MADKFQWVKLFIENPKVIIGIYLFLVSTSGFNFWNTSEAEAEAKASQEQIAVIADHYAATTTPKIVVQKSSCGACMLEIRKLRKEYHND